MKRNKLISQSELESYLWGAATLLRGYINAGDYKQFIFPLLFYKRLCDVYEEELADALEESGGDQRYATLPEQHRFKIPEDTHWKVTRTKVDNVGKAIQESLRAIETANPDTLYGVFGDAQWTNKDRLPDHMLRELIEHFSSQTLSLANCPEDEPGVGYEFLIKKSADPWGRNIYGTPPQGRADYAFWQHIIKSMKAKSGRCAILFPHGVLFRNEESAMREKLVAHDVV